MVSNGKWRLAASQHSPIGHACVLWLGDGHDRAPVSGYAARFNATAHRLMASVFFLAAASNALVHGSSTKQAAVMARRRRLCVTCVLVHRVLATLMLYWPGVRFSDGPGVAMVATAMGEVVPVADPLASQAGGGALGPTPPSCIRNCRARSSHFGHEYPTRMCGVVLPPLDSLRPATCGPTCRCSRSPMTVLAVAGQIVPGHSQASFGRTEWRPSERQHDAESQLSKSARGQTMLRLMRGGALSSSNIPICARAVAHIRTRLLFEALGSARQATCAGAVMASQIAGKRQAKPSFLPRLPVMRVWGD